MKQLLLYVVFLVLIPACSFSQINWENQWWTSVQVEKKIFKGTKGALSFETRWDPGNGMAVSYFPELAIQNKWSDFFSSVVHYRFITRNEGLGYRYSSHRLMLDAIGSKEIRKTDIGLRLRVGREDEPGNTEQLFSVSEIVFRQKISVKHKFFKQEFSLSFEQFETIRAGSVDFDQRRYVAGTELKIARQHYLSLFIMYQDLVSTRRVNFGTGYIFKFKN